MQRVISRVHQIVTTHTTAGDTSSSDETPLSTTPSATTPPMAATTTTTITTTTLPAAPSQPTSVIQKEISLAVERLKYATLLSERKKAIASLRDLAHSYTVATGDETSNGIPKPTGTPDHVALGLAAIPVVLHALVSDPRDTELMEAMLELLQQLVMVSPSTAVTLLLPPPTPQSATAGSLRSAVAAATMSVSGTQICLQLLRDPSPWIRGPTITLVKHLQEAQQSQFATSVLECKEGLRRLLEVVEDKREHIRDAALQVLVKMTEREKNVQQFLAFEDGFVRLFAIMEIEGLRDGSSVVSDCLQIVNNMLRDNLMNQTLFRDLPFLATHLPQLLSLPSPTRDAQDDEPHGVAVKLTQKKRTMKLSLQLVRFLVAPLHEAAQEKNLDELATREKARKDQELPQIQSMITRQRELMGVIGEIVCCGNEELTDLQLQALDLIELLCNGNGGNQIILVNLQTLPSRRSLLSELIKLDIAEDETPVAAAATNLLDALFSKNESAKMAIFQHLHAPPPAVDDDDGDGSDDALHHSGSPPLSAGRVLLDALITNAEAITTMAGSKQHQAAKRSLRTSTILSWKACHRFAFLIADSEYCKTLALRIPRQYENADAQSVAGDLFLTRCLRVLGSSGSSISSSSLSSSAFQVKIAMLTMLIQWCIDCPTAVREVVGSVTNLSVLVEVVAPVSKSHTDGAPRPQPEEEDERVQLQGLVAILLGCCLEYLEPRATEKSVEPGRNSTTSHTAATAAQPKLTRQNLVDLISKRVGLENFMTALIRFQQSPHVVACSRAAASRLSQRARMLHPHHALYSPCGDDEEDQEDQAGQQSEGYLFPLYDRSFTILCRDHTDKIQARVLSIFTGASGDDNDAHAAAMGSSGGGGVNGPSAASAYQDLIRMQDKQIHEQQKQITTLKAQLDASSAAPATLEVVPPPPSAAREQGAQETLMGLKWEAQMKQLRNLHAQEKSDLERQVATLTAQCTAFENRLQGLSKALELVEAAHAVCVQKTTKSTGAVAPIATDAMAKLMADLERETRERRRVEEDLRCEVQKRVDAEKKIGQGSHASEMATLQLTQQLEELKMLLAQKDEQLAENNEMAEVFRQGQESAARTVVSLKHELEKTASELAQSKATQLIQTQSKSTASEDEHQRNELSKHEAAAKEMYQLWEKERGKVRELKTEWEQAERERLAAVSKSQELEQQLAEMQRAQEMKTKTETETEPVAMAQQHLNDEMARLRATVESQCRDIEQLRGLFEEMQNAAKEAAIVMVKKTKTIEETTEKLHEVETHAAAKQKKSKKTIAELEDEIARMFFDQTDHHRKSKASLKQAEQELARVFLEKVEMEKQLADLLQATTTTPEKEKRDLDQDDWLTPPNGRQDQEEEEEEDHGHTNGGDEDDRAISSITRKTNGSTSVATRCAEEEDALAAMDDLLIVLASMEIQCTAFREGLEQAKGPQAVVAAVELSRKRGAMVI